jgi:hypothetical protein
MMSKKDYTSEILTRYSLPDVFEVRRWRFQVLTFGTISFTFFEGFQRHLF